MAESLTPAKADLEEVVRKDFPGSIHEKGTYLQRSGVRLFLWMLYLTSGILVGLFVFLIISSVFIQNLPTDPSEAATYVASMREAAFTRFISGVERLILNFCLPVMTGILGYVFGTRDQAVLLRREVTD